MKKKSCKCKGTCGKSTVVHINVKKSEYEFLKDHLVSNLKTMPVSLALSNTNMIASALATSAALHKSKKEANLRIKSLVSACETLSIELRTILIAGLRAKQ